MYKEISIKVNAIPKLQFQVSSENFEMFTEIASYYNCTRAELLRALIKDLIKSYIGA